MIDYTLIAKALEFYQNRGFQYVEVPWIVPASTLEITKPKHAEKARDFATFAGSLVASAEQSFLDMMLHGNLPRGRYVAATPCFRDEPELNLWTRQYFFKVELIDTLNLDYSHLQSFAKEFFGTIGIQTQVVPTEQGSDLFAFGVELGSYGVRQWEHLTWSYGTGLAEPRASLILKGKRK